MDFRLNRVQIWSGEVSDEPGGIVRLLEPLAEAGANLEFIWSRRLDGEPGRGLLFVAPVTGLAQTRAAQMVGLNRATDLVLLRIDGSDRPGVGHFLAACLSKAGINLRGMSMTAVNGQFVAYVACDSPEDTARAVQALAALKVD